MLKILIAALGLIAMPALAAAPGFSIADANCRESSPQCALQISKNAKASSYSKIRIQTADGTAKAGIDYQPLDITITIANSQLSSAPIISIIARPGYQGDRSFRAHLSIIRNGIASRADAIIMIKESDPAPPPIAWTKCADEGGDCNIIGTANVRYGAGSSWVVRPITASVHCTNAFFGDPAPGIVKECDTDGAIPAPPPAPSPAPSPTPAPSPSPTPNPCYDYSGSTPLGPVPGSNCPARMCPGYPYPVDISQPCPAPIPAPPPAPAPDPAPMPPMAADGVAVSAITACGYPLPLPAISVVGTWLKGAWIPLSCIAGQAPAQ